MSIPDAIYHLKKAIAGQSWFLDWKWSRGGRTITIGIFSGDFNGPFSGFYALKRATNVLGIVEVEATPATAKHIVERIRIELENDPHVL